MDFNLDTQIIDALRRENKPLPPEALMEEFEDKDAAAAAVERLLKEGRLVITKKRRLALPEQTGLVYGRIQGHARGFGFFIPEDGSPDCFVPADAMHGAMHGDKIWVRLTEQLSRTGAREAEVVMIAVRAMRRIVGTFEPDGLSGGYVVPDDPHLPMDMMISGSDLRGAGSGDKVVAEITRYPDGRRPMAGKIAEVLGAKTEAGTDILSIIRRLDLPEAFGKGAVRLARAANKPVEEDTVLRREDLRAWNAITIDGADAKDLDDAVSLSRMKNGNFLLGVHIADVSHYVAEGSPLDKEAFSRGTSVYLLDRVIPMFPKEISNGVCSLNEKETKLTMSCIMEITPAGKVVDHRISETVIRTSRRMVYEDVNKMLSGNDELCARHSDALPMLRDMQELMGVLNANRVKRGSLDFDLSEARIILDDSGRATGVEKAERGVANRMIEEFMLIANETVAQHMRDMGLPMMYRVHETPDKEKLTELNAFLQTLGYGIKNLSNIQPRALQKVLAIAKNTKEENVVNRVVLRSLKKARYCESCLGHFGLAAPMYCHFTSPIRRYPDLIVHRLLKEMLHGGLNNKRIDAWTEKLPEQARHLSERERVAMEAERAVDDLKKCEYMKSRIGAVETGIISGVAQYGFFVELSNTVEGMVRAASIDGDYFVCDEKNYRMVGRNSGRVYRLGDEVKVKIAGVDMESANIDFELVQKECGQRKNGGSGRKSGARPLPKARGVEKERKK